MNAGKDLKQAQAHAQANANRDGKPRHLHSWRGTLWIEREKCASTFETVYPKHAPK